MVYLSRRTKDVCVILDEAPHPSQTCQSSRELVAVDDSEIRHSPGQILIRDIGVGKYPTVTRAVHRFQSELLLLNLKGEHAYRVAV